MQPSDLLREGERVLTICNACRYCEGYCAVFPAMEKLVSFPERDLNYLANLCHNCRECFYACHYTAPHKFDVDIPRTLTRIRVASYNKSVWPSWLAWLIICGTGFSLWMPPAGGTLYAIVSHRTMVTLFGALSLIILLPMLLAARRFWNQINSHKLTGKAILQAAHDALNLEYLRSGGAGCTYPDDTHSNARRWFHHLTFYGFALCFASTCVAAFYHYALGWIAPYAYTSIPVVLGAIGGTGLLLGPPGLILLALQAKTANWFDAEFSILLFLTGLTGLLTLALRETPFLSRLLILHLAIVAALFVTLPYGKFVHGIYRSLALLRYALEGK